MLAAATFCGGDLFPAFINKLHDERVSGATVRMPIQLPIISVVARTIIVRTLDDDVAESFAMIFDDLGVGVVGDDVGQR